MNYSDRINVDRAIRAIGMADRLAGGVPKTIRISVALEGAQGGPRVEAPTVVLSSGTQAFTNTLTAVTNKLNSDKAAAEAYLVSVGVTTD